jgi:hypothetical protein
VVDAKAGDTILVLETAAKSGGRSSTSALIARPVITLATRHANTVGDRVMRCLMDGSTRNSSPDMWREDERSSSRL